jgi:hypothetical protein
MGGGSKAINPDSLGLAGFPERAITNQSSAQQRSGFRVRIDLGDWKAKAFISHGIFGVTSIERVTSKSSRFA